MIAATTGMTVAGLLGRLALRSPLVWMAVLLAGTVEPFHAWLLGEASLTASVEGQARAWSKLPLGQLGGALVALAGLKTLGSSLGVLPAPWIRASGWLLVSAGALVGGLLVTGTMLLGTGSASASPFGADERIGSLGRLLSLQIVLALRTGGLAFWITRVIPWSPWAVLALLWLIPASLRAHFPLAWAEPWFAWPPLHAAPGLWASIALSAALAAGLALSPRSSGPTSTTLT